MDKQTPPLLGMGFGYLTFKALFSLYASSSSSSFSFFFPRYSGYGLHIEAHHYLSCVSWLTRPGAWKAVIIVGTKNKITLRCGDLLHVDSEHERQISGTVIGKVEREKREGEIQLWRGEVFILNRVTHLLSLFLFDYFFSITGQWQELDL